MIRNIIIIGFANDINIVAVINTIEENYRTL